MHRGVRFSDRTPCGTMQLWWVEWYLPKDTSIWNLGAGFMWKGLCRCHYGKDPEKRSSSIRAALNPDTRGEKAETRRGGPGGDGGRERGHMSPTQGALSHQQPEGGTRPSLPRSLQKVPKLPTSCFSTSGLQNREREKRPLFQATEHLAISYGSLGRWTQRPS